MPRQRRCVAIGDDRDYLELRERIDAILRPYHFSMKMLPGSTTWMPGPELRAVEAEDMRGKALIKLPNYGHGDYVWGVRQEFAARFERLRDFPWPRQFCVSPAVSVAFSGFTVQNDAASLQLVERVVHAFDVSFGPSTATPQAPPVDLDAELRRRGL